MYRKHNQSVMVWVFISVFLVLFVGGFMIENRLTSSDVLEPLTDIQIGEVTLVSAPVNNFVKIFIDAIPFADTTEPLAVISCTNKDPQCLEPPSEEGPWYC